MSLVMINLFEYRNIAQTNVAVRKRRDAGRTGKNVGAEDICTNLNGRTDTERQNQWRTEHGGRSEGSTIEMGEKINAIMTIKESI